MKKKLCVLLFGLCLVSISACANKAESDNPDDILVFSNNESEKNTSLRNENGETTAKVDSDDPVKAKINIEDIAWNVDEKIVDNERYVLLEYKNNTPYTIAAFEIIFKEKSNITEEEKSAFYSDIQKMFEASDEEIEEIKIAPISMHAETERAIEPGEFATNVNCFYYTGYYYLKNMTHYNLVEPDIATIKYVDENKIYTVYYDYKSKKYSIDSEIKVAYQWSQTELGSKIPKPDVKIVESDIDNKETFMFDAYGMSLEQFNAYVEDCKSLGYTVDSSAFEGFYSADNASGYNIYLSYDEDDYVMNGTVKILDEDE